MMSNVYLKLAVDSASRLLCLLDRNPASRTYGCCDRTFWHYKTVDFPSARAQESVLMLALLYSNDFEGNSYYQNRQVLEWCRAIFVYWAKMQEHNGSFNEWYPKENSFVATAFSSCAVSEALLVLKGFDFQEKQAVISALRRAADWLVKRTEQRVSNQLSGCALALYNIYLLSKVEAYRESADAKINILLGSQKPEGWWKEYTGPDIGYLSLMASYLVKYHGKSGRKDILPAVRKTMEFLSYFVHPDFGIGGVYGCRNTSYFIPYCAEALALVNTDAASIAVHLRRSLSAKVAVSPLSLDDRYLSYTGYEWLEAGLIAQGLKDAKPRFSSSFVQDFPEGKMYVASTEGFYLIINYAKGGAFMLSAKKAGKSFSDSGALVSVGKAFFSSGCVSGQHKAEISKNSIVVSGPLYKLNSYLPTFPKIAALRLLQAFFGRYVRIGLFVKKLLRDVLITEAKPSDMAYVREFVLEQERIRVVDKVDVKGSVLTLTVGVPANFIYVPSASFFGPDMLSSLGISSAKPVISRDYSNDGKLHAA